MLPGHTTPPQDPEEAARRKALEHRKLQRMIDYADATACLRATILEYFGDPAVRVRCDACGTCRPDALDAHERELLRTILVGVAHAGERYGRQRIISMLIGVADLPAALARLSTTGALRHESHHSLRRWIDAAIGARLLIVSPDQYRTLSLSDQGRRIVRGQPFDVAVARPPRPSARYRGLGIGDWGLG